MVKGYSFKYKRYIDRLNRNPAKRTHPFSLVQWKVTGIVLIMILCLANFLSPVSPVSAQSQSIEKIQTGAKSAIMIEQSTGRILYEKDAHTKRRIASITKIMTAVLAIESGKMDENVTITDSILKAEGSAIYLQVGEKIKLSDLVYGLMLRSGNDAAIAIAEYVGGSVEGFSALMNQKAEWIGMKNSHFSNPHGLDDSDNHYSTAYDMAILTKYAMGNKTYQKIAGTKIHRAPNPNEVWDRVWKNKNKLLTEKYKYCTGGKTGYTKKARRTLVTTATKDDLDLITVTIDDSSDWADHIALYEAGFASYAMTEVVPSGTIKTIKRGFYKNKAYLKSSLTYPLTKEEMEQIEVKYELKKPKKHWKKGKKLPSKIGTANVILDGRTVISKPIYLHKKDQTVFGIWKEVFYTFSGVKANG